MARKKAAEKAVETAKPLRRRFDFNVPTVRNEEDCVHVGINFNAYKYIVIKLGLTSDRQLLAKQIREFLDGLYEQYKGQYGELAKAQYEAMAQQMIAEHGSDVKSRFNAYDIAAKEAEKSALDESKEKAAA